MFAGIFFSDLGSDSEFVEDDTRLGTLLVTFDLRSSNFCSVILCSEILNQTLMFLALELWLPKPLEAKHRKQTMEDLMQLACL